MAGVTFAFETSAPAGKVTRRLQVSVRFGTLCGLKSDISRGPSCAKLGHWRPSPDQLVCRNEQRLRHCEAKHPGGLELLADRSLDQNQSRAVRRLNLANNLFASLGPSPTAT
jgi:hypothetical protein